MLFVARHRRVVLRALQSVPGDLGTDCVELGQIVAINDPAVASFVVSGKNIARNGGFAFCLLEKPPTFDKEFLDLKVRARVRLFRGSLLCRKTLDALSDVVPALLLSIGQHHRVDVIEIRRQRAGLDGVLQHERWGHDAVEIAENQVGTEGIARAPRSGAQPEAWSGIKRE